MNNKNKKEIIEMYLLGGILLVLILILSLTAYQTKMKSNIENKSVNEANNTKKDSENDINNNFNKSEEDVKENSYNNSVDNTDTITNNSNTTTNRETNINQNNNIENNDEINDNKDNFGENNEESTSNVNSDKEIQNVNYDKNESTVISYFTSLNSEVDNLNDENNESFREKAKNIFSTTVDFLFNDGTIKGYKFKDLTLATKLKILKLTSSIDNKIESYFPNYKQNIKEKCLDLKAKIAISYLETTTKFCNEVGEDVCQVARDDFNNMKESYGYTWDIIKSVLVNGKEKITPILSEWYKSIK